MRPLTIRQLATIEGKHVTRQTRRRRRGKKHHDSGDFRWMPSCPSDARVIGKPANVNSPIIDELPFTPLAKYPGPTASAVMPAAYRHSP